MAQVIVAGGGMAGLAIALFGARRGHRVTVVDRDPGPPEGSGDDLAAWERRGVAQAHFAHGWPARSARVLREEVPELLDDLAAAGIGETDVRFGPSFPDDRTLAARRPVYEAVLRRFVAAEPGVQVEVGSVSRLLTDDAGTRIVGVGLADGRELTGDLVVDAGGRRSASSRWLVDLGFPAPAVDDHPCGLHYLSRDYRLREGRDLPENHAVFDGHPCFNAFTFVGDNGTFATGVAVSAEDPLRAALQDSDTFDRVLASLPQIAPWMEAGEPIGDVHVMAGLSNRRRRLVQDGRVVAPGLVLVGDAAVYTNPTLGQGVSLGFWMAQTLADLLERAEEDPAGISIALEGWIDRELGPRFDLQVRADRRMRHQLEQGVEGAGFLPPQDDDERHVRGLWRLAAQDPEVGLLLHQSMNLLISPLALRTPALREAVLALGPAPDPPDTAMSRQDFESLVAS